MNTIKHKLYGYINWVGQLLLLLLLAFIIRTFLYGLYQVPTGSMEPTILVGERFIADKLTIWWNPPQRGEIIAFDNPTYEYSNNTLMNAFQRYVWGPDNWTKRVIGIPGDHVEGKIENGKPVVYLNDKKLDEPYVNPYPLIGVWRNPEDQYAAQPCGYDRRTWIPELQPGQKQFYKVDDNNIRRINGLPDIILPGTPQQIDIFDVHLGPNEYWAMGDNRLGSWDSRGWGKLDGKLIHGRIKFRIWSIDSNENWWIVDLIKHPIDFWKRVRWGRCMQRVK